MIIKRLQRLTGTILQTLTTKCTKRFLSQAANKLTKNYISKKSRLEDMVAKPEPFTIWKRKIILKMRCWGKWGVERWWMAVMRNTLNLTAKTAKKMIISLQTTTQRHKDLSVLGLTDQRFVNLSGANFLVSSEISQMSRQNDMYTKIAFTRCVNTIDKALKSTSLIYRISSPPSLFGLLKSQPSCYQFWVRWQVRLLLKFTQATTRSTKIFSYVFVTCQSKINFVIYVKCISTPWSSSVA